MAKAMRLLAAALFVGLVPALRADDPKAKADKGDKADPAAIKAELQKLNKVTGDDGQREALLRIIKDKPKIAYLSYAVVKITGRSRSSRSRSSNPVSPGI